MPNLARSYGRQPNLEATGWEAPIGVPSPDFGIVEVCPAFPSPWTGAVTGYYFVSPTHGSATDSNNPNGYPSQPRVTVPSGLTGPAVVVMDGAIASNVTITGTGTRVDPIFVTSYQRAVPARLTGEVTVVGSYVIFERLYFGPVDANDSDFFFYLSEGNHHVTLRYCEFDGNLQDSGGIRLGTWGYTGGDFVTYVVVDHCTIHDIGDVDAEVDQDAHGVTINGSGHHIWVTHNSFARCGGDSLQIEAQAGRRASIHHVYFGKNYAHHNRQSGGWCKNATDVIFSQNRVHDFRENSGGPGSGLGSQYDAEYLWFLFNDISACNIGINIASADASPGTFGAIIGNVIHDQDGENPTDPVNGGAIVLRGGTTWHVVNNTLVNVDAGVNMPPASVTTSNINNNIILTSGDALYRGGAENTVTADRNFYSSDATFDGTTSGTNAQTGDPQTMSASDFRLKSSSAAIDAGALNSVYATFESRYGISITRDADGRHRPNGSSWDMGAYEWQS